MTQSIQEETEAIEGLSNKLDQSVRVLKRVLSEDQEQEDRGNENPESLFDQLD